MSQFDFDPEKSALLRKNRGIGFEEIIVLIEAGHIRRIIDHPNAAKYPHQKMYYVEIDDYIYAIPTVRNDDIVFLKTIYPSRKATRTYKRGASHAEKN